MFSNSSGSSPPVRAGVSKLIQILPRWWTGGTILASSFLVPATSWALGRSGARVWFPENLSTYGSAIDRLFTLILWITGIIFVLVEGVLLIFLFRYRARSGVPATYTHGNNLIEVIWTIIPAFILVFLGFQSQQVWSHVRGTPPPSDLEVEVMAEQFAWNIRYPGADGRFDTADDIKTINQMHIPVNQTVLIHLKSKDVIHSFFLPHFRIKQDAVPGITGHLWLEATKVANVEIVCAELCGLGHYRMRGFLTIESPEAFRDWLAQALKEQQS